MADNVVKLQDKFKEQIDAQVERQNKRQEAAYATLMESLDTLSGPEESGLDAFDALLEFPDDAFQMVAPLFLEQFESGLGANNTIMLMVQQLNLKGKKVEDAIKEYENLIYMIDEEFSETLSPIKRSFFKQLVTIIANKLSEVEGVAKKTITIPIELCNENAKLPAYAHLGDAGVDIYSLDDYEINPGESIIIPTGLKMAIPKGYAILIQPRSGISSKTKLRIANTPGLIDAGYRDEIGVIVENIDSPIKDMTYDFDEFGRPIITSILHGSPYKIEKGTRFAQMRLVEVPNMSFLPVESVSKIGFDRQGGFGSSGLEFLQAVEESIAEVQAEQNTVEETPGNEPNKTE